MLFIPRNSRSTKTPTMSIFAIQMMMQRVSAIGVIYVITNDKFYEQLKSHVETNKSVIVLHDGTTANETRLGAIVDLQLVIDTMNSDCITTYA